MKITITTTNELFRATIKKSGMDSELVVAFFEREEPELSANISQTIKKMQWKPPTLNWKICWLSKKNNRSVFRWLAIRPATKRNTQGDSK